MSGLWEDPLASVMVRTGILGQKPHEPTGSRSLRKELVCPGEVKKLSIGRCAGGGW